MEILRRAANPWGQEVLVGVGWDLIWAAAFAGIGFMVGHVIWRRWWLPRAGAADAAESGAPAGAVGTAGVPSRLERHGLGARLFHWSMAAAMFVLLVTAFFPILGLQFDWVTIHWAAGLVLLATVVYHVVHALFWQGLDAVWVDAEDVADLKASLGEVVDPARSKSARKPGKYPADQKLFHHVAALAAFGAIGTGLLMMVRVDTPFWGRNPYLLSDALWGWVYVLHGLSGVGLITLTIAHVYFALRPEKFWMTRSMIRGWITRDEYLAHHDPERWQPVAADRPGPSEAKEPVGAGSAH